MTQLSRREFLSKAPAAAALVALPEPEAPEPQEEEYPHATGWRPDDARHALPEEVTAILAMYEAEKALEAVLDLHGPGCADVQGCSICVDTAAVLWALGAGSSGIAGCLTGGPHPRWKEKD